MNKLADLWRLLTFERHNRYCRSKGYYAAMIEPPARRVVVWRIARALWTELRQWLALKIAPWLDEGPLP